MKLQHFVVRMLFDPQFRDAVYAGPVPGLTEADRGRLTAADPRRWRADPLRPARTLSALIEEFPGAVATHGAAGLDHFFASPEFVDCVHARGSVAAAFGAWLVPRAGAIATLESAIAAVRRARPTSGGGPYWQRSPGVTCVSCPLGTLETRTRWLEATAPEQWRSAAAAAPDWPTAGVERLLVERRADGVAISAESPEVSGALEAFAIPRDNSSAAQILVDLGLDAADVPEVLRAWFEDGWLVRTTG